MIPPAACSLGSPVTWSPARDPNLIAWWKQGTDITVSTGVSQWDDQSGNGYDFVQATAARQPTLDGDGKTITFDDGGGSNDHNLLADFGTTVSQPFTVFALIRSDTWTNGTYVWVDSAGTPGWTCYQTTYTYYHYQYTGAYGPYMYLPDGTFYAACWVANGTSSLTQVTPYAAPVTGGSLGTNSISGLSVGHPGGLTSFISLREVFMFDAVPTSDVRQAALKYLTDLL